MRVVLGERQLLLRLGLRAALAGAAEIELVGEAETVAELLVLVGRLRPQLVLLDCALSWPGSAAWAELREALSPPAKLVLLGVDAPPGKIAAALAAGACAYIDKRINPLDLAAAVRLTADGSIYRPHAAGGEPPPTRHGLTARELVILQALARGQTTRAIASDL